MYHILKIFFVLFFEISLFFFLGGTLQAHLFQDRMRVVKPVSLGHSVSVGSNSVVLLGGKLHNNVNLHPLSLSMRDEELPPRTEWYGSPASRVVW